jgi:hypothetical protein
LRFDKFDSCAFTFGAFGVFIRLSILVNSDAGLKLFDGVRNILNLNFNLFFLFLCDIDALTGTKCEGNIKVGLDIKKCISLISKCFLKIDDLVTGSNIGVVELKIDAGELIFNFVQIAIEAGFDSVQLVVVDALIVLLIAGIMLSWLDMQR